MHAVRKTVASLTLVVLVGLLTMNTTPSRAQETTTATATVAANLRSGPGGSYPSLASVPPGTALTVLARSDDFTWLLVHTVRGTRGWVSVRQVQIAQSVNVANLPISSEIIPSPLSPSQNGQTVATEQAFTPVPFAPGDLGVYAAQITPGVRNAMRKVYALGLQLGNNPRVFSKVGDCLEGQVWFLYQYGDGNPYELGNYGRLQDVINHFMVSPRPGVPNPYIAASQAAHAAFTSASVQDAEWADPKLCQVGESPLACEYRVNKPSVAIIMFGVVDVESLTAAQFSSSLRKVVKQTLALGIIPIMSTAPENLAYGDKAAQFNRIVTQIAAENSAPLIHLRDALYPLTDHGLDHDGLHLTPGAAWTRVAFTAPQLQLGLPVWNLLALQSLDNVWRHIMN